MDLQLLSQVVDELAALLHGARVDRVLPVDADSFCLAFHHERRSSYLLLSAESSLPRMHLLSQKPAGSRTPVQFCLSLRKHLTGSRLTAIRLVDLDRVVEMLFSSPDSSCSLVFELFGAHANLMLIDPSSVILAVHRSVPPGDRVKRPLLPGLGYEFPTKPVCAAGSNGVPDRSDNGSIDPGDCPKNAEAEALFSNLILDRHLHAKKTELLAAAKRILAKADRKANALQGDLRSAGNADEHKQAGDLILANIRDLEKGQASAELIAHDGQPRVIALDPGLSIAKNADRYYRKYKKAKTAVSMVQARLRKTREEQSFLTSIIADIASSASPDDLLLIQTRMVRYGFLTASKVVATKASGSAASASYRTIIHQGWEILIGKSAKGNDMITMKLARPDDLWLHAEGMPGSHVLVRNPEGRDVPDPVLAKAAALAARYSKGKGSTKVPVAYTRARFVSKPKGAKPGLVMLAERKTIMVAPDTD